jgi:hypothetical protein
MISDLKWSPQEKALARKAFNQALELELQELIREAQIDPQSCVVNFGLQRLLPRYRQSSEPKQPSCAPKKTGAFVPFEP